MPNEIITTRHAAINVTRAVLFGSSRRRAPAAIADREPPLPVDLMQRIYREYEQQKAQLGQLDFEDLLERAIQLFTDDAGARERFRGRYRAFTVDEYQDVNLLQQTLLDLWLGDRDDLCVVGDDYQSIYGFTGATPRHLLSMPERYTQATKVKLVRNYRSRPQVLEIANRLAPELGGGEKEREPINADSHLTFMGAGLKNCVTYLNKPEQPVYFIELDGVYKEYRRQRRTTVLAYDEAEMIYRGRVAIPTSTQHQIESFNLKDPRFGLFEQLDEWLDVYGIEKGCIDIRLAPDEHHAGLTVNEYETLLMRNDLPQVLADPLRYMVERGKKLLRHPGSIPGKTRNYAAFDLIHLYNEFMDTVPLGRAVADKILSVLSTPASRILRLKRHITLLVSTSEETGPERIVQGTYQSPIMVQHHPANADVRYLDITLRRFK